jgi:ketosteroid isomerase-like protein
MTKRTLMITMNADWRAALRAADKRATARRYQGEVLNFETAASFLASSQSVVGLSCTRCRGRERCRCGTWHAG